MGRSPRSGLLRLAYVLTGNRADAEDAVQDALARAPPRWDHIRSVGDPDAYVRRMVVLAHTFVVAQVPQAGDAGGRGVRPGTDRATTGEDRDRVWRACLRLPEAQRVAVLRYYEQLEYAEFAALTGVAEGSARSRVSRGLATLRTSLGEEESHD
jgi:DNA-directed RNA polymerase specialized sigma24 family protein